MNNWAKLLFNEKFHIFEVSLLKFTCSMCNMWKIKYTLQKVSE